MNTPNDMSDTQINALVDFGTLPAFNAETLANGRANEIDLTKRPYDIDVRHEPSAPAFERYSAIDLNTYDGGPDAPGDFIGRGSTPHLARMALLDRFAEYDAEGAR